jgi:hypothetical protein
MRNRAILLLLIWPLLLSPIAGWSQAMVEAGGTLSAAGGLGAGLAASRSHGRMVGRSYEAMIQAQQALVAQTQAIQQYMKSGCKFEAAKQWASAEKSFKYVLKVVAVRDGPGSSNGVPALKHLVTISAAQDKLDEAIGFQKTVLAFAKGGNPFVIMREQYNLSNLYLNYGDCSSAEPMLKDAVSYCDAHPSLPIMQQKETRSSYAKVLRQLHKDSEAEIVESAIADGDQPDDRQIAPTMEKQALQVCKPSSVNADGQKVDATEAEQRINQLNYPPNLLFPDPSLTGNAAAIAKEQR